jgi:hypothetical protein
VWQTWTVAYAEPLAQLGQLSSELRMTRVASEAEQLNMAQAYAEWVAGINLELQERRPTLHDAAVGLRFRVVPAGHLYSSPKALRPSDGLLGLLLSVHDLGQQLCRRRGTLQARTHMGRLWARFNELRRDESVPSNVAGDYEQWMRSLHKALRAALKGG